jgi:hypothetical protein
MTTVFLDKKGSADGGIHATMGKGRVIGTVKLPFV